MIEAIEALNAVVDKRAEGVVIIVRRENHRWTIHAIQSTCCAPDDTKIVGEQSLNGIAATEGGARALAVALLKGGL